MKSNGSMYVAAVLAVLVGYFTYQWWFNPSRAVKRRLGEIAAALSMPAQEKRHRTGSRALAQLRTFLAPDVRVRSGEPPQDIASRDAVLAHRRRLPSGDERRRPLHRHTGVRWTPTRAAHAYMTVDLITPDPQSGQPTIDSREASVDLEQVGRRMARHAVTTAELKPAPPRP